MEARALNKLTSLILSALGLPSCFSENCLLGYKNIDWLFKWSRWQDLALHKRQPWPIHANVTVWMTKSCLRDHRAFWPSDLLTIGTSGLLIFGIFWRSGSLRYVAPVGATGRAGLRPYAYLRTINGLQADSTCKHLIDRNLIVVLPSSFHYLRILRKQNPFCFRKMYHYGNKIRFVSVRV